MSKAKSEAIAAPAGTALHLQGLRDLEHETSVDSLALEGELPSWLEGSLIRTGPAKWEIGSKNMRHWFDGLAMLHRFSFAGGSVSYANRFLQTKAYRAATEKGRIGYSEFATDPCRSLFSRIVSIFSPKITDNPNVNVAKLGERFIAMTETPIPIEFDADTLEAAGVSYDVPGTLTTAHPHLDRASAGMVNYAAKLGPSNSYRFFLLRPDAEKAEVIAEIPCRRPAYMHSFGLTERWLVLAEFPYVVNPISIPLSGRPYIENFRWMPELGTRFTLFDRHTGDPTGPFETDAFFAFHHVNAYESDGDVVVDICTYPDAKLVQDLYMERLKAGKPIARPELRRFTISTRDRSVKHERLVEEPLELPRINHARCNEHPYRYVWGHGIAGSWPDRIVKADLEQRTTIIWEEAGCFPGEPVFVAAPGATAEDDGVLLSIVFDSRSGRSYLLVLDAHDLNELARAQAPHHIPYGFHGQFDPA